MKKLSIIAGYFLSLICIPSQAQDATAHYIANEGVMIERGTSRILFDPLFNNSYGHYTLPPAQMREAIIAGNAPYDGVDAVFISHSHGDHFSPGDIINLLKAQPKLRLFAPNQAVEDLRKAVKEEDTHVFSRVNSIRLEYKDEPITLEMDGLLIEAVRIPHSGWPEGSLDVENIVYRVTLDEDITVLHMGDADPNDVHFARDAGYWDQRHTHLALPPYWFFINPAGPEILNKRLKPGKTVGIHVPEAMPDASEERAEMFRGVDLFTEPGEIRTIGKGSE